jgi:putative ABC transport system permease protein
LLTENLLLTVMGGLLGVLLAWWGLDLVIALRTDNVPQLAEIRLNRETLLFSLAVSLLTGLLFGLLPAWRAARADLGLTLKQGSPSRAARQSFSRKALVVGEVALSLVLLVGAGLMMRSFVRLRQADLGFNPEGVVVLRLELPESRYPNEADSANFSEQLLARARQLEGVQAAEIASGMPLKLGLYLGKFEIESRTASTAEQPTHFGGGGVGLDYFRLLGTPIKQGRAFNSADTAQAPRVVIINEAMARRYFPGEDPLGQRFRLGPKDDWATIVGIAGQAKGGGVEPDMLQLQLFFPYAQQPSASLFLLVRTELDPARLIPALKSQVWSLDVQLPIKEIQTAEAIVGEALSRQRFSLVLMTVFAALAVILAAVGVYGLMAYLVTQSTHEIGIRMALGAQRRDVLKLVVGQGMALSLIGVAIGLALAFGLTRFLASLLYGVGATDPLTFMLISLLLMIVALLACYLPARRAMKVDPMVALRYE